MKQFAKKALPLVLAASLPFTMGGVAAAKGKGAGHAYGHGKANIKVVSQVNVNISFKDIRNHWAMDTIEKMAKLGLIAGYGDLTFQPNKPVTQAEAIVMVSRLFADEDGVDDDTLPYKNVPAWAKEGIAIALDKGLISPQFKLEPNKPATRLFVTMLLVNAIGAEFDNDWQEAAEFFADVDDLDKTEKAYLVFAYLQDLIKGYADGTFKPNKPVTRAEMAVFLDRVLGKIGDEENTGDEEQTGEVEFGVLEDVVDLHLAASDDDTTVEYRFEKDGDDYEASLEVNDGDDENELDGKDALKAINELLAAANFNADEGELDQDKLLDELADRYDLSGEGKLEVVIDTGEKEIRLDEEVDFGGANEDENALDTLLGELKEVDSFKLSLTQEDRSAEISFDLTDDATGFQASVKTVNGGSTVTTYGEAALPTIKQIYAEASSSSQVDWEDMAKEAGELFSFEGETSVTGELKVNGVSYEYEETLDLE